MRILLKIIFSFAFLLLLFKPSFAYGSESISSFTSKITAHKDGSFDVAEKIVYDFGENNRHGIFRTIPLTSKVGDLNRTINITLKGVLRDETQEQYSSNTQNSTLTVKIGNPNKTITGEHSYIILYLVKNGVTNYETHDEIYWNITGNDWRVPIYRAISFADSDFDIKPNNYICFTGVLGSKEQNCAIDASKSVQTNKELLSGEGLSVAVSFPPNTFPKNVLTTIPRNADFDPIFFTVIILAIVSSLVLFNLIAPIVVILWYLKKKRKNRFGKVVVNFDIPKDKNNKRLLPAEAGTIDTAILDRDDVTGTIFDLAIRKFIKLEQIKNKGTIFGIGSSESVKIIKLKNYDKSDLTNFEKILLDRLFEDGDEIDMKDLGTDFYKTFSDLGDEIFKEHVKNGFYTKNPKNQRLLLMGLGVASIVIGGLILGFVLIFLSRKLNGRTAIGDEIDWKIDGLKLFLKSMDRNYKWQAKELYIVEKMIPFAIALGYIDKFMEQLKLIKPDYNPTWYSGRTSFYIYSSSLFTSMNTSFATASKSSSGFSSGGFSGGGGGGGGGGSW